MTSRVLLVAEVLCSALLLTNVCDVASDNGDVTDDVIIGARCRARCLARLQVTITNGQVLIVEAIAYI